MMEEPLGVVFDTMIFLQAVGSGRGPAFAALQRFEAGEFRLFVSRDLLDEVGGVLSRPEIRRKMPRLTEERVAALIERLESKAALIPDVPKRVEYPRDPDDEPVLNLAVEARAKYLVSRDHDLLSLMEENRPEGKAFRNEYPNLTILDPLAFLRKLVEG
jgi:putative PIN family toxin of toxin-antitoxin system